MVPPTRGLPTPQLSERGQYPLSGGRCFAKLVSVSAQGRTTIVVCRTYRVMHFFGACSSPITERTLSQPGKVCASCLAGRSSFPWCCRFARSHRRLSFHIPCHKWPSSFCSCSSQGSSYSEAWAC